MKATRYMRIPFFVTGYQVTPENMEILARWCKGHVVRDGKVPFVRVPVIRPSHSKHTEAHVGTHILLSITEQGELSFKVYPQEWLDGSFIVTPTNLPELVKYDITEEVPEVDPCNCPGCHARHVPTQSKVVTPLTFRAKR